MSTANVNNANRSQASEDARRRTANARWALITTRVIDVSKAVRVSLQESTRLDRVKQLRAAAKEINRIADAIENTEFED